MLKYVAFFLMIVSSVPGLAQKLVKVGEFASYEDDAQFLPGGIVVVHNDLLDSRTNVYKYRAGKFVKVKTKLLPALRDWKTFNWDTVDGFNQIEVNDLMSPPAAGFLPPHSKVKAVTKLTANAISGKVLTVVCYTVDADDVPEAERGTVGGLKKLHLLLISRNPGTEFIYTEYTKLQDFVAVEEGVFGTLLVEQQPQGIFVVLYYAQGGSHQTDEIVIYRLKLPVSHRIGRKRSRIVRRSRLPYESFGLLQPVIIGVSLLNRRF